MTISKLPSQIIAHIATHLTFWEQPSFIICNRYICESTIASPARFEHMRLCCRQLMSILRSHQPRRHPRDVWFRMSLAEKYPVEDVVGKLKVFRFAKHLSFETSIVPHFNQVWNNVYSLRLNGFYLNELNAHFYI